MDTRFFNIRATTKQLNYLCVLARKAGYSSLRDAAASVYGVSSSKATKMAEKGRISASDMIDKLKAMTDG